MNAHEVGNPLVARGRRLGSEDQSRYYNIKLVLQLRPPDRALCSIIFTKVGGQRLSDTRLGVVTIAAVDPDGRPLPAVPLLRAALEALEASGQA